MRIFFILALLAIFASSGIAASVGAGPAAVEAAATAQEQERDLAITTGNWPGGIPPWKGENNQCRSTFRSLGSDNPCVRCTRGSYCACKYAYPGPQPQAKCYACKTSDICPGNGIKYPGKKPPAETFGAIMSRLRGAEPAASSDGSWQSFPTPGPKPVARPKQNPNAKCGLRIFGRCDAGSYCRSVSYDKYACTKCKSGQKCTGDGMMGPP